MKKIFIALSVLALVYGFAWAGPNCESHVKAAKKSAKKAEKICPVKACMVEGAEVTVENTDEGVIVRITSKDPAIVKQIQEKAVKVKEQVDAKKK